MHLDSRSNYVWHGITAVGTGELYESYKPDKPWTGEFLYSTVQTFSFFFTLEDQKDVPHFLPNLSSIVVPSPMLFSLGKLLLSILLAHFPIFLLLRRWFKKPLILLFPPCKWKHHSVSLLSWHDPALVGFRRQPKCFVSDEPCSWHVGREAT